MVTPSQIIEHMEVIGFDGQHLATVDHRTIRLTGKNPVAQGQHHFLPLDTVTSIEGSKLNMPAAQAMQEQKAIG